MILLVHSDLGKIKDFIMWADVEFAMQLELLETRRFDTQEVGIIDLGGLEALSGIEASEPLYIICHGGSGSPVTSLDGEHYRWDSLGAAVGRKLSGDCKSIVLFACYAADGSVGSRPIDVFVKGLGRHRSNVRVTAYQGATITNTMATVTARDSKDLGYHSILVADELRMGDAGALDKGLRKTHQPRSSSTATSRPTRRRATGPRRSTPRTSRRRSMSPSARTWPPTTRSMPSRTTRASRSP